MLDDANHVTAPWGSVNSRVFDALASGCLVITNGELGSKDTFSSLLPVFSSGQDLKEKLDFYLSNTTERLSLTTKLRSIVLANHTYDHRAMELAVILKDFGIDLNSNVNPSDNIQSGTKVAPDESHDVRDSKDLPRLCVGIQYQGSQMDAGKSGDKLTRFLANQYMKETSKHKNAFDFQVSLINFLLF